MASVTSLDSDLKRSRHGKYTPAAAAAVSTFITTTLSLPPLPASTDLMAHLKTGVLLCKLYNHLGLPTQIRFKDSKMPFVQMENIAQFLAAVSNPPVALPPHDRFLTVDLYERKDPAQVVQCLAAFSRVAHRLAPDRFTETVGGLKGAPLSPQPSGAPVANTGGAPMPSPMVANGGFAKKAPPPLPPSKPAPPTGKKPAVSAWTSKHDERSTAPAWNVAQYGFMGGASQGKMGISFGAPRQITNTPKLRQQEAVEREKSRAMGEDVRRKEEAYRREVEQAEVGVAKMDLQAEDRRREREAEEAARRAREAEAAKAESEFLRLQRERKEAEEVRREEARRKNAEAEEARRKAEAHAEEARRKAAADADAAERTRQAAAAAALQHEADALRRQQRAADDRQAAAILARDQKVALEKEALRQQEQDLLQQPPALSPSLTTPSRSPSPRPISHPSHLSPLLRVRQLEAELAAARAALDAATPPPQPGIAGSGSEWRDSSTSTIVAHPHRPLPTPPRKLPPTPIMTGAAKTVVKQDSWERGDDRRPLDSPTKHDRAIGASLLERERERERARQREWEEEQKETARREKAGGGEGGWNEVQYGSMTGADQAKLHVSFGGRRQIIGPRNGGGY
ncbi:hypothetical protein EDC01DRAFT_753403 [Geopyxis carbonaria]|nr:hypothetical protein EDC01DRAFT_753403 [Geopyxis carbonaria]